MTLSTNHLAQTDDQLEVKAGALYARLNAAVDTALTAAKQEGKDVVIVFGEDHTDRGSMLAELMLMKIAQEKHVNNFAVEAKAELLNEVRANYQAGKSSSAHFPEILADADRKHFTIIPADDHTLSSQARENIMVQAVQDMKGSGMFLLGADHLVAVTDRVKNLQGKHVVAFNVANITDTKIQSFRGAEATNANALITKPGIAQFDIGDEFRNLDKDKILGLAAKVTGQYDLPKLLVEKDLVAILPKLVTILGKMSDAYGDAQTHPSMLEVRSAGICLSDNNAAGIEMARNELQTAIKAFDKDVPNLKHPEKATEIKMELLSVLAKIDDHIGKPLTKEEGVVSAPSTYAFAAASRRAL